MVLGVVLELLGRDGGAEKVLEVLHHVLLGGRKGARLRLRVELRVCHDCVCVVGVWGFRELGAIRGNRSSKSPSKSSRSVAGGASGDDLL